ncbi:MAG: sigma-54 dependent transcriptional regulator [Bdellovibrionaceae bacterium]|nr:sigma-54 dependent transcriptional regulator [Pseudobdellovibrionaceae bacterium]
MLRILVVDDDQGLRFSVRETLAQAGAFEIDEAFDGINAMEKVKAKHYDVVLLDVDMPRLNGLETLKLIKEHDPSATVIIMTAFATIDDAVRAVKEGAYNYLSKPVKGEELVRLVERAMSAQTMISSVAASAPVLMDAGRKIIGGSAEMQKVFNIIHRLAKVDTPVLIRGASGTGKELVARAIHFNSARKDEKFVAINCSAIPENLFESELFGHEKGSFTGAHERKIGKFQFAEGGTLFLDELGDMPVMMQVKLLRVLQEKLFTPVGSNREIQSNVRVIAATNRPLEEMIKDGRFREDLFYRLNVIPIFLPPLAERKTDIEHLVNTFIKKFNKAHNKRMIGITPETMACLKKYTWPGNIRELENVVEHAFILENSNLLTLGSLPESVLAQAGVNLASMSVPADLVMGDNGDEFSDTDGADDADESAEASGEMVSINGDSLDFNKHKEAFEREFIIKALKTFKGRINQTALHANIPKKTLLRKIEKYGIVAKDFAEPR